MSDKFPFFAAESGTWRTTSPNPHVDLSGTALTLGTYPVQTFAAAAADTTLAFDSGQTCTVTIWKDATNFKRYEGAVWTDAATDTLDLSAATLMGVAGSIANGDAVSVVASMPAITPAAIDAAPAEKGVTNGDSHDHSTGDGAQIFWNGLGGIPEAFIPDLHAETHAAAGSDPLTPAAIGAEPALGNPGTTGYVLSSTTAGVRSWVAQSAGGGVDTANSPAAGEFAKFTDADTIEGRTAAEARGDLDLEPGVDFLALRSSHIDGALITVTGNAAISVSSGAAALESGGVLAWASAITATGLTIAASTWYHVYVYSASGTPTLEVSTTAPAAPYIGTARSKNGSTGYRYLGSLKSDASGYLYRILHTGNTVVYLATTYNAPFRCLSAGSAVAAVPSHVDVDLSGAVPISSQMASILAQNGAGTQSLFLSDSGSGFDLQIVAYISGGYVTLYRDFPTDSGQRMAYRYGSSGGSAYIDVVGYIFYR